jgi:hypothetical protein
MNSAPLNAAPAINSALPNAAPVTNSALPNAAPVTNSALPNAAQCNYYIVTLYLAHWRKADYEGEDQRN